MVFGCVLFVGYVSSYFLLSRRGIAQAEFTGVDGFAYVTLDDSLSSTDVSRHYLLARIFSPLNLVDHHVFGAYKPLKCILIDLS